MYRNSGIGNFFTPAVKYIIILNAVMLLISYYFEKNSGINLDRVLGIYYVESSQFKLYQIFTHFFMHANLSHLFFNMFAVFMFGITLERVWGTKRFVLFYVSTALGAALIHFIIIGVDYNLLKNSAEVFLSNPTPSALSELLDKQVNTIRPEAVSSITDFINNWSLAPKSTEYIQYSKEIYQRIIEASIAYPTVGASGAVFGILLAFGMLFPNTELFLLFLPIPIKAKYFVAIYAIGEFFAGVANYRSDNIAHFAHLGGMLFAYIIIVYWRKKSKHFY